MFCAPSFYNFDIYLIKKKIPINLCQTVTYTVQAMKF